MIDWFYFGLKYIIIKSKDDFIIILFIWYITLIFSYLQKFLYF